MQFVAGTSTLATSFLEFLQEARCQAAVDEVVREMTEVWWESHVRSQFDPAKPTEVLEVVGWERANPPTERLREELLEVLFKVATGAVVLIAGRFIDKGNDADAGERSHEDLATVGNVPLFGGQPISFAGIKNGITDISENRRLEPKSRCS
jgi:hypothetical protein